MAVDRPLQEVQLDDQEGEDGFAFVDVEEEVRVAVASQAHVSLIVSTSID